MGFRNSACVVVTKLPIFIFWSDFFILLFFFFMKSMSNGRNLKACVKNWPNSAMKKVSNISQIFFFLQGHQISHLCAVLCLRERRREISFFFFFNIDGFVSHATLPFYPRLSDA